MSLAFSRRSFLKYSAVAAVAVAGASLFSGCESQGDSYNLLQEGAGSMTILQVTATMGTYNETDKKYVALYKDTATTEIYTHIDNEALRVAARANPLSRVKPKGKIDE